MTKGYAGMTVKHLGQGDETLIAVGVSVQIIDAFKEIDIDDEEGDG